MTTDNTNRIDESTIPSVNGTASRAAQQQRGASERDSAPHTHQQKSHNDHRSSHLDDLPPLAGGAAMPTPGMPVVSRGGMSGPLMLHPQNPEAAIEELERAKEKARAEAARLDIAREALTEAVANNAGVFLLKDQLKDQLIEADPEEKQREALERLVALANITREIAAQEQRELRGIIECELTEDELQLYERLETEVPQVRDACQDIHDTIVACPEVPEEDRIKTGGLHREADTQLVNMTNIQVKVDPLNVMTKVRDFLEWVWKLTLRIVRLRGLIDAHYQILGPYLPLHLHPVF